MRVITTRLKTSTKTKGGYMRKNNSFKNKKILALLMATLMGGTVFALSACDGSSSSSSSSSSSVSLEEEIEETEKEKASPIDNADFSIVNDTSNEKIFATVTPSWTRSTSNVTTGVAQSSKSASGILDTSNDAWKSLTTHTEGFDATKLTEAQAKAKWDTLTLKDKLAYYKAWEDANKDKDKDVDDLSFYEKVTIDGDDIPTVENPRTWDYSDTLADDYDSHVLMIHNNYDTATAHMQGTAQKFTSTSTVTVTAGTAMQLSLWVKTADLRSQSTTNNENGQEAVDKGAYIEISHTVGGKTLQPLQIKNINTQGVTENNGWKQFTFYLRGTSFADTTFTLVLGLGQGGGTDVLEYVNGYAFFDDIVCTPISDAAFEEKTENLEAFTLAHTKSSEKTVNVFNEDDTAFALDFSGAHFIPSNYLTGAFHYAYTTETNNAGEIFTAVGTPANTIEKPENAKKPSSLGATLDGTNDIASVFTNLDDMKNNQNRVLKAIYQNSLAGEDGAESKFYSRLQDKSTLMLVSANGAPLTAKNAQTLTVAKNEYLAFSFFVKTASQKAVATVTLKDAYGNVLSTISSIDAATFAPVTMGDDENYYDGWQQCFFFIANETQETANLTVEFQLGPTTIIGTEQDAYKSGFAAFANFQTYNFKNEETILEEEFALAKESTYAKLVTVTKTDTENNDNFDAVSAVSPTNKDIENNFANPKNYQLYQGGSKVEKTESATAGLLNAKYAEAYDTNGILAKLGATKSTASERWEEIFGGGLLGTANQPLVIYNENESTKAYGFAGASTSIAANNYKAISMRLKVSANTKAYVYLIDTDDDSFNKVLSIDGKLTYWYDDDGNVCASDPTEGTLQNKDIALKLQTNGLYKVNAAWWRTVSDQPVPDGYYANLQAYGEAVNGNLMVAEGGVTYAYQDAWQHPGNDGIAFYGYNDANKTAYAEKAQNTLVTDFSKLSALTPRYTAQAERNLQFTIDGATTNGKWVDVTFFIKAGENAKNYRLEIWNGARDNSVVAAANSYVIADSRNVGSLDETTYNDNLSPRENEVADSDKFESVFSFYDSAKFLRYNENIDDLDVGNSYDDYAQSTYTSAIAYLTYQKDNVFETYVNYGVTEQTPAKDVEENAPEDDTPSAEDNGINPLLLASSIAVAAVLVLAVISLIIRKAWKNSRKKRGVTQKTNKK